uniref:LAGLIDADG_2 domain-containing protein n=1 Tax=Schistosoma curassoni TaxID=6186 RepID=A0A183L641_9TREM
MTIINNNNKIWPTFFSVNITKPRSWSSRPRIVTVKSMIDVLAISGVYDGFGNFVVIYRRNPLIISHSLSPIFTLYVEPDLMKFFSKTLSKAGSRSSPTSSMSNGRPSDSESSKCVRKYL